MSASSHFMIPMSVAASRPRPKKAALAPRPLNAAEWEALDASRRQASLLALLGIYVVGLGLVVMLYEGEDIGVILSAFLAHAIWMAARAMIAAMRRETVSTRLGTLVVHSRARLVPVPIAARAYGRR